MIESPNPDYAFLFFREVVEPTVVEFMADRADKRRGCLACLALASMIEHYAHARFGGNKQAIKEFKRAIRKNHKAVGWISDVANATRHVVRSVDRSAIGFNDIQAMELGCVGILRCDWPINGEEILVGTELEWRLGDLIEFTMAFWRGKLGLEPQPG